MRNKRTIIFVILILLIIVGSTFYYFSRNNSSKTSSNLNSCVNNSFGVATNGHCVQDIQNMINFIETDNLNQCKFTGGARLSVSGAFDSLTEAQVKVAQTWFNCYNQQEGAGGGITISVAVDQKTWPQLCTYAYTYPKQASQSSSPYLQASLASGKDAGC